MSDKPATDISSAAGSKGSFPAPHLPAAPSPSLTSSLLLSPPLSFFFLGTEAAGGVAGALAKEREARGAGPDGDNGMSFSISILSRAHLQWERMSQRADLLPDCFFLRWRCPFGPLLRPQTRPRTRTPRTTTRRESTELEPESPTPKERARKLVFAMGCMRGVRKCFLYRSDLIWFL